MLSNPFRFAENSASKLSALVSGMACLLASAAGLTMNSTGQDMTRSPAIEGRAGAPYAEMPQTAPIGVRADRYLPVPTADVSPSIDAQKGYRLQELGRGLYMVTDNAYQSMFLVHDRGVVVVDAPPPYAKQLKAAIAEVTRLPITHVVYSHAHQDHIAGVTELGGKPIIIAHEETKRILERANDPKRPLPAVTFKDRYTLALDNQKLELTYHGVAHQPGNIFIYAPEQKTLMVVDVVFPGWMPWRRFALAHDVQGYFDQVASIEKLPFSSFVGGHVSRLGTREDVSRQLAFMNDLKAAASSALQSTAPGEQLDAADKGNPWAVFDNYIDRVAAKCVASLEPKWKDRLAGFDVYVWDQCYAMEQSLRID